MSSSVLSDPSTAFSPQEFYERLAGTPAAPFTPEERRFALDRFFALRSGREKPGRFWRIDFETLAPSVTAIGSSAVEYCAQNADSSVVVCDLATASREHPQLLAKALGKSRVAQTKFGALAAAFAGGGTFVYIPADRASDQPILIRYAAGAQAAMFPWTVVLAERGARATIVERVTAEAGAFICGATEIITGDHADVTYAAVQNLEDSSRAIFSRAAAPGRDARVAVATALLGGALSADELVVAIEYPGSQTTISGVFFPTGTQHVDVISTVEHSAGEASSDTLIKSAARDRGQARYLGNIRIAPHAQGSDARLRDDALLLSPTAHVDSVPALEIGANDVKAYHGATVGALDAEQIFYLQSRGIEAGAAERMIALGFFEPAVERFPSASLRDEIRAALAAKLA
ncbi:MAG TPA: Fe-S cluster assembly protein SufD [Candidatus Baltobacteraceae bacterium]|nr:Fe-S cluster assembly protein SufD [Candidatus Baltobacteraceae bacterium]